MIFAVYLVLCLRQTFMSPLQFHIEENNKEREVKGGSEVKCSWRVHCFHWIEIFLEYLDSLLVSVN